MGRLTKSHLIEAAIWLSIIIVFFASSFQFNQPIEIYKFGATGWPRVVLFLLLLAAAGNLYYQYHYGSATQQGRVGLAASDDDEAGYETPGALIKLIAVLITPFIFAILLKPVGIYFGAPFFHSSHYLVVWGAKLESNIDYHTHYLSDFPLTLCRYFECAAASRQYVAIL